MPTPQELSLHLQRLEHLSSSLREHAPSPTLDALSSFESSISSLERERSALGSELKGATPTPMTRKLAKDFAKLNVEETLRGAREVLARVKEEMEERERRGGEGASGDDDVRRLQEVSGRGGDGSKRDRERPRGDREGQRLNEEGSGEEGARGHKDGRGERDGSRSERDVQRIPDGNVRSNWQRTPDGSTGRGVNDGQTRAEGTTGTATERAQSSGTLQTQTRITKEVKHDHDEYAAQVERELKQAQEKAGSVRALNENIALLVGHQAEDAAALAKHSTNARDDVVAGLGELADLKKKEAGKHTTRGTTVSAVIGGAVGIVGGPIGIALGVAAGAAVGAAIGSSLTSLSRRSIDREVRMFKEKFRVQVRVDGSCVALAQVFENERWSLTNRVWSGENLMPTDFRTTWSMDETGIPLSPNDASPLNVGASPRPPTPAMRELPAADTPIGKDDLGLEMEADVANQAFRPAYSSSNSNNGRLNAGGLPRYPIKGNSNDEEYEAALAFQGNWRWVPSSKWRADIGDRFSDAGGWQYAFSFAEGAIWSTEPSRTSLVRRRRWIREQVLDPGNAYYPERIANILTSNRRVEANAHVQRAMGNTTTIKQGSSSTALGLNERAAKNLDDATFNMQQSLEASRVAHDELKLQGIRIADADIDVAIVEDASAHAERVARAVNISGVFRNAFTKPANATERAQRRVTRREGNELGEPEMERVGWDSHSESLQFDPLDKLSNLCENQLGESEALYREVKSQNDQLEALLNTTMRTQIRVSRAREMI